MVFKDNEKKILAVMLKKDYCLISDFNEFVTYTNSFKYLNKLLKMGLIEKHRINKIFHYKLKNIKIKRKINQFLRLDKYFKSKI